MTVWSANVLSVDAGKCFNTETNTHTLNLFIEFGAQQ